MFAMVVRKKGLLQDMTCSSSLMLFVWDGWAFICRLVTNRVIMEGWYASWRSVNMTVYRSLSLYVFTWEEDSKRGFDTVCISQHRDFDRIKHLRWSIYTVRKKTIMGLLPARLHGYDYCIVVYLLINFKVENGNVWLQVVLHEAFSCVLRSVRVFADAATRRWLDSL